MYEFKMYSPCCTWYLEVQTDCVKVVDLINQLFHGFIVLQRPLRTDLEFLSVSIEKQGEGYVMTGKGKTYTIKDLNGVGFYLYAVIDKLVEGNMDSQYWVFHGGVVAKNNYAYGIIAPTMTGKSTLVTYLSLNGFEYLSDDYIFVRRDNREIRPLPLPGSLRATSVLGDVSLRAYTVDGYNELRGENNVLVSLHHSSPKIYCLNKIFFINRCNENRIQMMDKGDLYKELLFNMKNALNLEIERITVRDLVEYVDGYKLSFNNLGFVMACIENGDSICNINDYSHNSTKNDSY